MQRLLSNPTPMIAKINVTPIIDVALVLVIILLITAPMLTVKDLEVSLPKAQTRGAEDEARITITLGKDGQLALDENLISPESLPAILRSRLAGDMKGMLVVVRADEGTPHRAVRTILSQARAAGAMRLAIATRQKVKVDL
jgi:biopolymer transport protein ExbD